MGLNVVKKVNMAFFLKNEKFCKLVLLSIVTEANSSTHIINKWKAYPIGDNTSGLCIKKEIPQPKFTDTSSSILYNMHVNVYTSSVSQRQLKAFVTEIDSNGMINKSNQITVSYSQN